MTEDLDKQIRDAIAALITAAVPESTVYAWNVLSHKLAEWPGLFGNPRNGCIIKRANQTADRKNAVRDRIELVYDAWFFYEFRSGKAGDNSDDEFAEIMAKAYNAIKAEPRLGLDDEVERHDLLQYQRVTTLECGEETLHFAQGRLKVYPCC